jgi:hypothetical protein
MALIYCWKSSLTWSFLFLLFASMFGPVPAIAKDDPDTVLYEVTEDMYLKDGAGNFVASVVPGGRRTAVAQLSGWAKVGTPLPLVCPVADPQGQALRSERHWRR